MELDHWAIAAIASKIGLYTAALFCVGTAIFWCLYDKGRQLLENYRALIITSASIALMFSLIQISVRAGLLIDDGVAGLVDMEMLALAADGPLGHSTLTSIIGLLLIAIGVFVPALRLWLFSLGAVLVAVSFALVGHATAAPRWLLTALISLHLLAVAFWLGALLPLYMGVANAPDRTAHAAHQFGKAASVIVPVLIFVGIGFVAIRFGGPLELVGSSYGWVFLLKILAVAVLLSLAAANKLRFVPRLSSGDASAAMHLRTSIAFEALCFLAIFTATATMTTAAQLPS